MRRTKTILKQWHRSCCVSVQSAPAGSAAVDLQFRLYRGGSGMPMERVPLSAQALEKVCRVRLLTPTAPGSPCRFGKHACIRTEADEHYAH